MDCKQNPAPWPKRPACGSVLPATLRGKTRPCSERSSSINFIINFNGNFLLPLGKASNDTLHAPVCTTQVHLSSFRETASRQNARFNNVGRRTIATVDIDWPLERSSAGACTGRAFPCHGTSFSNRYGPPECPSCLSSLLWGSGRVPSFVNISVNPFLPASKFSPPWTAGLLLSEVR